MNGFRLYKKKVNKILCYNYKGTQYMAPDCNSDSLFTAAEANIIRQITYKNQNNYFRSNLSFKPIKKIRN